MVSDNKLKNLEDEIKLLKGEIKNILLDLRASMMRSDSPFSSEKRQQSITINTEHKASRDNFENSAPVNREDYQQAHGQSNNNSQNNQQPNQQSGGNGWQQQGSGFFNGGVQAAPNPQSYQMPSIPQTVIMPSPGYTQLAAPVYQEPHPAYQATAPAPAPAQVYTAPRQEQAQTAAQVNASPNSSIPANQTRNAVNGQYGEMEDLASVLARYGVKLNDNGKENGRGVNVSKLQEPMVVAVEKEKGDQYGFHSAVSSSGNEQYPNKGLARRQDDDVVERNVSLLDVNMVSSLMRWAWLVTAHMGQDGLNRLLDLYISSHRGSAGLKTMVVQISQMIDREPMPPVGGKCYIDSIDLIHQLHGILTSSQMGVHIPEGETTIEADTGKES